MKTLFLGLFLGVLCCASSLATTLDDVRKYISQPEKDINLFVAKLLVDHIIDPSFDINEYIHKVNIYVNKVRDFAPAIEGYDQNPRLEKIRKFMFEKGEWNNFQSYDYDFGTYEGKGELKASDIFYTSFDQKKGRCVTLSVLYYIVLDMCGYPVNLGISHNHMFVLLEIGSDPDQDIHFESSDFGNWCKRTEMIKKLSKKSRLSRAYNRRLSKKEAASSLLSLLVTQYIDKKEYEKALEVAELVQEYHPTNIDNLMNMGHCYFQFYKREKNTKIKEKYQYLANYYADLGVMLGFEEEYSSSSASAIAYFEEQKKLREGM